MKNIKYLFCLLLSIAVLQTASAQMSIQVSPRLILRLGSMKPEVVKTKTHRPFKRPRLNDKLCERLRSRHYSIKSSVDA